MRDPTPVVLHQRGPDVTPAQMEHIGRLIHLAFPNPTHTPASRATHYARVLATRPDHEVFTAWQEGRLMAHALIFPREIHTSAGNLRVLALAAVASDPEARGRGFGRAVTRAALAQTDNGRFAVSLFQTGVPDFYAKLGAGIVRNRFINSRFDPGHPDPHGTREEPWWNPHVMIFPAVFPWPEGTIDLLGPGY